MTIFSSLQWRVDTFRDIFSSHQYRREGIWQVTKVSVYRAAVPLTYMTVKQTSYMHHIIIARLGIVFVQWATSSDKTKFLTQDLKCWQGQSLQDFELRTQRVERNVTKHLVWLTILESRSHEKFKIFHWDRHTETINGMSKANLETGQSTQYRILTAVTLYRHKEFSYQSANVCSGLAVWYAWKILVYLKSNSVFYSCSSIRTL